MQMRFREIGFIGKSRANAFAFAVFATMLTAMISSCVTSGQHYRSLSPENQITEVQSDLSKLGYYTGVVDGIYGSKTEKAIRDFQRDHGMTQDGKVSESLYIQAGLAVSKRASAESNHGSGAGKGGGAQPASAMPSGRHQAVRRESNESTACGSADWTGVVKNVADLLDCDTTRAIQSLSSGRVITFDVASVSFRDGKFVSQMTAIPTYAQDAHNENMKPGAFSWGNWMDTVHNVSSPYNITCIFPSEAGSYLKRGSSLQVRASLVNYSNRTATLNCLGT
jgi:peptidoglycan hydrolase-like protein with peptidoglycan-binding domain